MDNQISTTLKRKYSHLKKPNGNFKYEIVYKKSIPVFACGPMGEFYEIKFKMEDGTFLYVNADDWGMYSLRDDISEIDLMSDENTDYSKIKEPIEDFTGFSKAKKSKFYDLYLENVNTEEITYDNKKELRNLNKNELRNANNVENKGNYNYKNYCSY